MSNDKNQKKGSLIPSGKREITEYSSNLISRGLDLAKIVDQEQKEGLFPVIEDGKWGFIDKTGKIVIKPKFDNAKLFSEGLAAILIVDKWGYIDRMGKIVFKPKFDEGRNFSEGMACVKIAGKWGYINKTGRIIIKPQFEDDGFFNEGLACMKFNDK